MKKLLFLLSIILLLCSYCTKQDSDGAPNKVLQTITNGPWIQEEYLEDSDGDGVFVDNSRTCEYDNTYVFENNDAQSMSYNDIGDLCAPEFGPLYITGFWELKNNNQVLFMNLTHGFTQHDFTIASLTDTKLILELIDLNNPNAPTKQKLVLRR